MRARCFMLMLVLALGAIGALGAGCGKFEDPAIVIDLRTLSMVADPPEQLVAIDPNHPPDPSMLGLQPIVITALVADPAATRGLEYEMTACPPTTNDRCDADKPTVLVGGGTIGDPETAPIGQDEPIAILDPSAGLFAVVKQAVIDDPFQGFSEVDIQVVMRVNQPGARPDDAVWSSKTIVFGSTMPVGRTPNHNPTLDSVQWSTEGAADAPQPLAQGRCTDPGTYPDVAAGTTLHLTPMEPPGARETYVVPAFDGSARTITENLSYQWLAGRGKWDPAKTGGPRDPFGNDPKLDTKWTAPEPAALTGPVDVPLYIIQRDERGGQAFYQSCVHVHP